MEKKLNVKYSASQFFYFSMFASMFAFISVFLLDKGFNNTTIGMTLSLISLSSIVLQVFIANYVDRNKNVELQNVISRIALVIIVSSALLYFLEIQLIVLLLVVLSLSLTQAITPLHNSMAFLYEDFGIQINYGFARGIGSLAYALVTVFLGYIIETTSPKHLPLFYLTFAILLLVSIRAYTLSEENKMEIAIGRISRKATKIQVVSKKTFIEFMKEYQRLVFLMVGIIFLFYGHIIINSFFIQVITSIGGNSSTMGIAIFIGTILELPAMMNFNQLAERIPVHRLLKISAVFFLAKHLLTFLAPNLMVVYLAQALQIGAFSVAYPALVAYTQSVISSEDLVKGQSLLASSLGLSNIFASFTGGILLDSIGVPSTLLIGVVTTIIGLGIVFLTVEDQSKEFVLDKK